jgi:transcriptional regulator with XRE-family HTH domain
MKEVDDIELFVMLESKQVLEKLTDKEVADKIGMNRSNYNVMKSRKTAKKKTKEKIAEYLQVRLKSAVPEKTSKPKPKKLSEEEQKQVNERKKQARWAIEEHQERIYARDLEVMA